jgi:hypothetical protein
LWSVNLGPTVVVPALQNAHALPVSLAAGFQDVLILRSDRVDFASRGYSNKRPWPYLDAIWGQ